MSKNVHWPLFRGLSLRGEGICPVADILRRSAEAGSICVSSWCRCSASGCCCWWPAPGAGSPESAPLSAVGGGRSSRPGPGVLQEGAAAPALAPAEGGGSSRPGLPACSCRSPCSSCSGNCCLSWPCCWNILLPWYAGGPKLALTLRPLPRLYLSSFRFRVTFSTLSSFVFLPTTMLALPTPSALSILLISSTCL